MGQVTMVGSGRPSRTSVYERLDKALAELNQRYGGLPSPEEAQAIWEDIWHQEAHHSTALEGNTLVLRQVQALLDQGRAIGAKPLSEYNEVRGYADAAQWVYGQALEPGDWHDGRARSPFYRRERPRRAARPEPHRGPPRLPAGRRLQAAAQ